MKLYHFTELKNLESIKKQGLVPQVGERRCMIDDCEGKVTCYFRDLDFAKTEYTRMWGYVYKKHAKVALLEVDVPVNKVYLRDPKKVWQNKDAIDEAWEVVTIETIPPDNIKHIDMYEGLGL